MSDLVIVGLLAAVGGVLAAAIPAWRTIKKGPSKLTTDVITLVDAGGQVIRNLTDEIKRLDAVADEALVEAAEARREAKAANREAIACQGRIHQLERLLVGAGIELPAVTG